MSPAVVTLPDLARPDGLSTAGLVAYTAIVEVLRQRRLTYAGGCRAFYSPAYWSARGEKYGHGAVLVVVHDGADVGRAFAVEKEDPRSVQAMSDALEPWGLYAEPCTGWYTAIYESRPIARRERITR